MEENFRTLINLLPKPGTAFSKDVVILHGEYSFPMLQKPLFQKAKENLLPGEKVPIRADEEWGKMLFPDPFPPSATAPPLPKGEGYFMDDGFCDFAFGFAQNDRGEGRHTA